MTAPKSKKPNGGAPVRRTTTIDSALAAKLDDLAQKRNVSVSWLVGQAIRELLERVGSK